MNKTPHEIITELTEKFKGNIGDWEKVDHSLLENSFLLARGIAEVGQIINNLTKSRYRLRCCQIYDEIFSDSISAFYLSACALENAAKIVMRRVVEMGAAALYLWDMPHIFYAWEVYDHDLSFTEMITHVNSPGYLKHIEEETGIAVKTELLNTKKLQNWYGNLSDVVHGKISYFESNLPQMYTFDKTKWLAFTEMSNEILRIYLDAYCTRYNIKAEIHRKLPALKLV